MKLFFIFALLAGQNLFAEDIRAQFNDQGLKISLQTSKPGCMEAIKKHKSAEYLARNCEGQYYDEVTIPNSAVSRAQVIDVQNFIDGLGPLSRDEFGFLLHNRAKNRKSRDGAPFDLTDIAAIRQNFRPLSKAEEDRQAKEYEKSLEQLVKAAAR